MLQYLDKLKRNVKDYGIRSAFGKSLAYLLRPVYESRTYRIYRIKLDAMEPSGSRELPGFTFRWARPGDGQAIRQIEGEAEWLRGELAGMLAGGALCATAWHGERLAGFNLIELGEAAIPLLRRTRRFRPSEAWSSHIAVLKDFRRNGLARELRYRVFEELRARNVRKLYGGALISNLPSLRLARSVGFTELVDVDFLKVFRAKTWRYRRVGARERTTS